jgi:hypothetical protein
LLENPLVLFRDPVAGIVDSERKRNEVLANTSSIYFDDGSGRRSAAKLLIKTKPVGS